MTGCRGKQHRHEDDADFDQVDHEDDRALPGASKLQILLGSESSKVWGLEFLEGEYHDCLMYRHRMSPGAVAGWRDDLIVQEQDGRRKL